MKRQDMSESAGDIQQYLDIVGGKRAPEQNIMENNIVDLGNSTGTVQIGQTYVFDNGLRWVKIINEENYLLFVRM